MYKRKLKIDLLRLLILTILDASTLDMIKVTKIIQTP
jgi:hypothetical protein